MSRDKPEVLVDAKDVHVEFRAARRQRVRAVDGVSFQIHRGEVLGLVGESGCGKSTLGRALIGLRPLSAGSVAYQGMILSKHPGRSFRRSAQIIFQDPYGSLNPRMTVEAALTEPIRFHRLAEGRGVRARVFELLEMVGLPVTAAPKYPHEFSGGQRQRVAIARALALDPSFIVCDEPISALDVSIQAQVMNLLEDLKERLSLTYLFISHDLAAVARMSTQVSVMYLGRVVESGPVKEVYGQPAHPYTQMLLSAVPSSARLRRTALDDRIKPIGEPPSPLDRPTGCAFRSRCPLYGSLGNPEICAQVDPELVEQKQPSHMAACHFASSITTPSEEKCND